jgi:Concanavalin A-like lectin/glucanases superfamily/Protein of unknown function (DUF2939)
MRWALWITITLIILFGVYLASPLLALHRMASAVEERDAVALTGRIDFRAVRRSLTKQIVATYLELTGKKLPLGAITKRFALSIADPIVARLMTVKALLDLLGKGEAGKGAGVPIDRAPFTSNAFKSVWRLWLNSDHLGRDFYVFLPPEAPRNEQFKVHLRLIQWQWKLVGIELPKELRQQLARELVELTQEQLKPRSDRFENSGLVAHWKFEEGSGGLVKDASNNGNDGTIVPETALAPRWGKGEFAGSVLFSGGNDQHVRIPSSASLNTLKKRITVVAHIYPMTLWSVDSHSNPFIVIAQRQWRDTVHPDLFYLGYGPKNNVLHYKWHLGLIDSELSLYRLPEGQDKPRVGEWVHLAGTYDGDTGRMSFYVNGDRIGRQTRVGEIRLDSESLHRPLVIGAEINGPNIDDATGEFNGYVDDVRIYNRALSDDEIKVLAEEARTQTDR